MDQMTPPRLGRLFRFGAVAGLAGGASLAVFLLIVAEPTIDAAVRFEKAHETSPGAPEMFTRGTQHFGGMLGASLYGAALGVLFALAFASLRHRLGGRDDWDRSIRLASAAFATIYLVPFLKYPANPPGVGDPATITRRTVLYVLMIAWSCAATAIAWRVHEHLRDREWDGPSRCLVVIAVYLAVVLVSVGLLPANRDAVPDPATLVWRFRLLSLGGQAVLWTVMALSFGTLVHREEMGKATWRRRGVDTGV